MLYKQSSLRRQISKYRVPIMLTQLSAWNEDRAILPQ